VRTAPLLYHVQLAQAAQSPLHRRHRRRAEQHQLLQRDRPARRLPVADLAHEVVVLAGLQIRQLAPLEIAQRAQRRKKRQLGLAHGANLPAPCPRSLTWIKPVVRPRHGRNVHDSIAVHF
jgi:hypothetical protein